MALRCRGGFAGRTDNARTRAAIPGHGDPSQAVTILQNRERLLEIMKDGAFHKRPRTVAGGRQSAE
jgi:hypothetical protein